MRRLNNKIRVTELDAVSDYIVLLYHNDGALANDIYLQEVMRKIESLSDRITVAIKSDIFYSRLREVNKKRNGVLRLFSTVLNGQAALPDTEKKMAAEQILSIFKKYTGISSKNYDEKSSLIESLLLDMSKPELAEALDSLEGIRQYLSDLRIVQDEFARVQQEFLSTRANKGESATSLKKPLLSAINDDLVVHLTAMVKVNKSLYGNFVSQLEEKFNDTAIRINKRITTDSEESKEVNEEPTV